MNPTNPEGRIGELERDMARMQQRVQDIGAEVGRLGQLPVDLAVVKAGLKSLGEDVRDVNVLIAHVRQSIKDAEARREIERKEQAADRRLQLTDSRNWRRALILGSFTVLAAIIAAAATIIASSP